MFGDRLGGGDMLFHRRTAAVMVTKTMVLCAWSWTHSSPTDRNQIVCELSWQEWLPEADGSSTDPEGHLQLLCGHHVFHHQDRLLCAV